MVCVFRILCFFRWLDDKLSAGLLQLHIKCPEAHFEGTIVFRVFLFFSAFEQSFSEFCQKPPAGSWKLYFTCTEENLQETVLVFSKVLFLLPIFFRIWEEKFRELWRKGLSGLSKLFCKNSEKLFAGTFFTKNFWVSKKILRFWPEVSLELRNLTKNLGKFGKTACHVTRGSFWGSFFWKKMFPNSFRILRSNVAINCQKAPGSVLKTTIHVSRATVWIGTSFFETKNNYRVRFWIFSVDFLKKLQ